MPIPDGPKASVGLYWFEDFDPSVPPGASAPLYQLLVRTDVPSVYFKAGPLATDWVLIGTSTGGGGGSSVNVSNQSVPLAGGPFVTLDFQGAGVVASNGGGGVADITIPGVTVDDEGVTIVTTGELNFTGAGVTVVDASGVAHITIPGGITLQDEGVPVTGNPHQVLNFVGAGVGVSDSGGVGTVTIPGGISGVTFEDEGIAVITAALLNFVGAGVQLTNIAGVPTATIPGGISGVTFEDEGISVITAATLNFVGGGVQLTNVAGVPTATIPGGISGVVVEEEGAPVVTASTLNFTGAGSTATNIAGVATIATPGQATYLPEQWVQNNVPANQAGVALSAQVSTNFDNFKAVRAGSVIGLSSRLTEAVTAGTLTVKIAINGIAGTLAIASTSGSNASGGVATQAPGIDTYNAGDTISVQVTTTNTFTPTTTDLEVNGVQVFESL